MRLPGSALFELHATHGFALVDSLAECRRRGIAADLFGFARCALRAGWAAPRVRSVIREALADSPCERLPEDPPTEAPAS